MGGSWGLHPRQNWSVGKDEGSRAILKGKQWTICVLAMLRKNLLKSANLSHLGEGNRFTEWLIMIPSYVWGKVWGWAWRENVMACYEDVHYSSICHLWPKMLWKLKVSVVKAFLLLYLQTAETLGLCEWGSLHSRLGTGDRPKKWFHPCLV